jgi:glycosyltransferase involved in cell wall biosynthesis
VSEVAAAVAVVGSDERVAKLKRVAIVPALNEERTIAQVIDEIRTHDPNLEIVVVDDGSSDRTAHLAAQHGAHVISLPFNLGIGGAVQTGYRYALMEGFDVAVQIDGDGQHDPSQLGILLKALVETDADIVIGSRFAGVGTYRSTFTRRLGIRIFSRIVSLIIGQRITDTSCSFRAVGRRGIALFSADYPHGFLETVEATAVAAKHGLRIVEIPVQLRERASGRSTLTHSLSIVYSIKVLVAIFVALFRRNLVYPEGRDDS